MTARLRVAQVTLGLEVGGQERLLVEMARHADRTRFDWTVIVLGSRGVLADAIEAAGVRVLALDTPPGLRPGLWRRLARLFRQERFDVVHTHDDRPLLYAMPAAWWAGVRRRIHTHHHGRLAPRPSASTVLGSAGVALCGTFRLRVARQCPLHDRTGGLGRARADSVERHRRGPASALPGPMPRRDGPIVTVARLSPEKDIANLLRAAQRVVASHPQARFEIAGAGPCRDELARLTQELNLSGHVVFHGEVRDIPAFLARARLFVLPSQSEGISLTLLEAMARGLPVVTTRVGGNPEVVDAGVTGLLAPASDPVALARNHRARDLLDDPARGRRMGSRCAADASRLASISAKCWPNMNHHFIEELP